MKKIAKIVTEGAWAIVNCKDTYTGRSRFSSSSVSPLVSIQKDITKNSLIARVRYYKGHCAEHSRGKLERNTKVLHREVWILFLNRSLSTFISKDALPCCWMFDTLL